MADETADVVVIGMGPGGEEVAGQLSESGLAVVGIERLLVGGECPYWGCVPSKMMIRAADLLAEARRIPAMAGSADVSPDWSPVAKRIREEATDSWDDKVAVDRFVGKGGRFIRGAGVLTGPKSVAVNNIEIDVRRAVVLSTGTTPLIPPIPGLSDIPYWTNREAIETTEVPGSLVVLGGGAIGLELAQVFSRFGSQVTVVEMADRLLSAEEPEASRLIEDVFCSEGITTLTNVAVCGAGKKESGLYLELDDGTHVIGDALLVATGRRSDLAGLGLDKIGITDTARFVPVDDHMRVAPGVWAVGDLTGKGLFTHIAMYQAGIAVADILGEKTPGADYAALPRVTFTDPEIGAVGMTERVAREGGVAVQTGLTELSSSARGWIHKAGNNGFIKLIEDSDEGVLIGATASGPSGGEVLGLLALAVHARIATTDLRSMIYAYPTFHRAIEDALKRLGSK